VERVGGVMDSREREKKGLSKKEGRPSSAQSPHQMHQARM